MHTINIKTIFFLLNLISIFSIVCFVDSNKQKNPALSNGISISVKEIIFFCLLLFQQLLR